MKRIAYLGWLGAGNLGDEACYQLFKQCALSISTQITCNPITISETEGKLFARQPGEALRSRQEWNPTAYDYVVLGGGSLLNADRYVKALRVAQRAGVPTAIWGTGFDGLPHDIIDSKTGQVVGSVTPGKTAPAPHLSMPEVFRSCRVAGVRGPVTAAWLKAHGSGAPTLSGDPGLLFAPSVPKPALPRKRGTVIWGMSKGATHPGTTHEALTRRVARWLRRQTGERPLIAVMWAHDLPAARQLAQAVGGGAEIREEPLTLPSFAELMRQSAWTLSYRLHGCILSAACGVPFGSIAYRSKCYDFALSIDAGEWVVDASSHDLEWRLETWLTHVTGLGDLPDRVRRRTKQYRTSLVNIVKTIIRELGEGQSWQPVSPR